MFGLQKILGLIHPVLRRFSLRVQTILLMGGIGAFICVAVAFLVFKFDSRRLDEEIQLKSSLQAELIRKLSLDALIAEDRPALQTTVDGLKELGVGIVGMEIRNFSGNLMASWKGDLDEDARLIEINEPIEYKGQNFGSLQLQWDRSHFAGPIKARTIEMTQVVFGSFLILACCFVIFVEAYFVRPLQYLETKVDAFSSKEAPNLRKVEFSAKELIRLDNSLEEASRMVRERATREQELQDERLRARSAEETARAKSEFLSLMSHEIRTPLGAILGFAQLLEGSELGDEDMSYVRHIRESGNFLLTIINDILDLSKIEANGIELDPEPFCVNALLEQLDSMVSSLADRKDLSFEIESSGLGEFDVVGDAHRIKQVLMNLAGNAVKFTESGGVKVIADARTKSINDEEVAEVRFSVIDTGIGMTQEQAERIFEPFSQADASVTRRFGGTGLGVSISRELVNIMGGDLHVDTEKDKGSNFYFTITMPVVAREVSARDAETQAAQELKVQESNLRLLIAEDDPINQKLITKIFQKLNQEIVFANDGEICLEILEKNQEFDAVFLDLRMPKVDGLAVLRRLRSGDLGEYLQHIPVAIMSADVLAKEEAADAGANDFIMKPIEIDHLKSFLGTVLQKIDGPVSAPSHSEGKFSKEQKVVAGEESTDESQGDSQDKTEDTFNRLQPISLNTGIESQSVFEKGRPYILVAEDNASMRKLLGRVFTNLGYEVDFAEDGVLCLEKLSESKFDVIVSDLRMPNMDGSTLISRIREGEAGEEYRSIPIAVITAEDLTQEEYSDMSANALISKPISIETLKDFLKDVEAGGGDQKVALSR